MGDVLDARDGVLDGSANCPVVEIVDHVPDPVALARVLEDPDCFTFQEMFPGGFTPQFGGDARDASLGPQSPESFDPGVYEQREVSANVDLNYTVNDMVNLAGGAEFRDEYFEIGIGEAASWEIGPFAAQGFSSGSNGFPGFSDIAAGGWHRANYAAYGDYGGAGAG